MNFTHQGQEVSLAADATCGPEPVSATQLKQFLQTGSTSAFYQLSVQPVTRTETAPAQHPLPSIQHLLLRYNHLFQSPSRLPPPRQVVHQITLAPSTAPINVRPYRYPHFQKNEIEKQVSELLSAGFAPVSVPTPRRSSSLRRKTAHGDCVWTTGRSTQLPFEIVFLYQRSTSSSTS